MCVRCSFGTCIESQVYGFESTCPLSNVSNKIEGGDLHLWRYWAAIQQCCLAPKESKHWWAWFWGREKKKLLWFHWDLSIKRIPYLTLALHTTVHLGSVSVWRGQRRQSPHMTPSPAAPELLLLLQSFSSCSKRRCCSRKSRSDSAPRGCSLCLRGFPSGSELQTLEAEAVPSSPSSEQSPAAPCQERRPLETVSWDILSSFSILI